MDVFGDVLFLMAKERMAEAERDAACRRALRLARPFRPAHVRLGWMLVRAGLWLMAGEAPLRG